MSFTEVEVTVVAQTDKAILVNSGTGEDAWIPKSQIHDQCEESDGTITSIFIPEWIAVAKGLV